MKRLWSLCGAVLLAGGAVSAPALALPPADQPVAHHPYRPATLPPATLPPATLLPGGHCPPISPTPSTSPSSPTSPTTPDSPTTPTDPGMGGGGGEGGSGGLSSAGPNMIGDLLGAGRSVSFIINRDRGPVFIEATGATNIVNPKVADNNSPIPRDRLGFRYNYFSNAVSITGLSNQTIFAPNVSLNGFIRPTQVKEYDYHLYTFNWEQTFLEDMASFELRVPIRTSLSSTINYRVGNIQGSDRFVDANGVPLYYATNPAPGAPRFQGFPGAANLAASDALAAAAGLTPLYALNVNPTPGNTQGSTETELDNITLILKGLLYQDRAWSVSGGVAVTAPTANDTRFTVTDFVGPFEFNNVDAMRVRDFKVIRETWGVAPFLAGLYASRDSRLFAQGFVQVDVPIGADRVHYAEYTPVSLNPVVPSVQDPRDQRTNIQSGPIVARTSVRDQVLAHMDFGAGYWLVRNNTGSWLSGFAPTMELHYTTTLNNARLANLPTGPVPISAPTGQVQPNGGGASVPVVDPVFPPVPAVGNARNRMDIVNLTVGATFVIADQATVATAVALPLRGGDNRTFDWEFQLQLNWYFGGPRGVPILPR